MMRVLIIASAAMLLSSCDNNILTSNENAYTLYRDSVVGDGESARVHIATFDVDESDPKYNQINCGIAAELFASQPGVAVRYWCEKGTYKP